MVVAGLSLSMSSRGKARLNASVMFSEQMSKTLDVSALDQYVRKASVEGSYFASPRLSIKLLDGKYEAFFRSRFGLACLSSGTYDFVGSELSLIDEHTGERTLFRPDLSVSSQSREVQSKRDSVISLNSPETWMTSLRWSDVTILKGLFSTQ